MMFAQGHQPKAFFTHAAKTIALQAIRTKRGRRTKTTVVAAAPLPMVNRFGRPYLPIDKGVPMPDRNGELTARPFALMEIGDSFFEAAGETPIDTLAQRIKWDAKHYRPKRFDAAEVTEGGTPGLRIWRLA